MDDRGRIALGIGLGALLGGIAGYFLLTERGRQMRDELEPRLNELLGEVDRLRQTFESTRSAVSDGWRSFNQLMEEQKSSAQSAAHSAAEQAGDVWNKNVGSQPH